ncbi:hypothetical protein LMH87_001144 [Akanthomyces muscarius]|uniref:Translation machinery associated TMA7 n=1 Tax=Akanthomyces muscarius TaxID=2231603 RepID=A0A9W8QFY2_AKAMU|nr:hypothetical protein LMH87_001144 [Akanthomyces muscarius]KAJ4155922.1 hypothetical protein LMH87_001144 [Akanthomyces muscarius]
MGGQSREGGKKAPLKAKKKVATELDSDDERRIEKQREDARKLKEAQGQATGKGPLKLSSHGLKKSAKK